MTAERFAVPVPGGRLVGDVRGRGRGVLLLHGFTLDRTLWDDVVEPLAASCRVARVDLRGHGESPDADAPYVAADDVVRVLDALSLTRAALVGLSWGGQFALDAALAHPSRVAALALIDSTLFGHAWSAEWRALQAELRALASGPAGHGAAADAWLDSDLFAPARAQSAVRARIDALRTPRTGRLWTGRDGAIFLSPPAGARLAEIAAPTLVMDGALDLPDFRAIARTLAQGIPGATHVTLEGAGHLPPLEAPRATADALRAFLDHALAG